MSSTVCLLFLLLAFSSSCVWAAKRNGNRTRDQTIDIELFYNANSQLDGDFVVSQLSAEMQDPQYPNLAVFTMSIGPGVTILGEAGNYGCQSLGEEDICAIGLLHYCVLEHYMPEQVNFLECYFQSELFPFDLLGATKQCAETTFNENGWQLISSCAAEWNTLANYAEAVLQAQSLRPQIRQTPYVLIDEEYASLGAVDLRKALCRSQAADDIWQCESEDKYKEPKVEIFYSPYGVEADTFFGRFNQTDADLVKSAAFLLSVVPNPNGVLGCEPTQESCWIHKAHWCAHESSTIEMHQLDFILCTFQNASNSLKHSLKSAEDLVKACLPDGQYEEVIKPCIENIDSSTTQLQSYQSQLNSLVELSQQTSLEIIIQGQSSVKAKNGLLEELCNNYFKTDNENLGCQVKKPTVQIFYETPSADFDVVLQHLKQFDQFSPFDQLMKLELIPYGLTTIGQDGAYTCGTGGADACKINWLQACLLKERWSTSVRDQYLVLQFIACSTSASNDSLVSFAKECLLKVYQDEGTTLWNTIDNCAQNDAALKEELRNKTEAIDLKQVPEIVVDGVKKTTEAGNGLLVYLCQNAFSPIKPKVCFEIDSSDSSTFVLPVSVFLHGDMDTQVFVQTQLKPLLETQSRDQQVRLRDVIDWQFVPWGPSSYNASSGVISCVGGPKECLVNRVLACATQQRQNGQLGSREDRLRVAAFLVCFFDWGSNWEADPLTVANGCSGHLSKLDNYPQLWQCSLQEGKEKLMLQMKATTEAYPNIGRWPSVVIGGEVQFTNSLTSVLCAHYKASLRPVECFELETSTVAPTTPDPGSSATTLSAAALTSLILFTFFSLLMH